MSSNGEDRDLDWLVESLRSIDRVFFGDELAARNVEIRWARFRATKHTFRFGAFLPHARDTLRGHEPNVRSAVILIHPVLAHAWVPDYVVLGTIYHEGLHAVHGPKHDAKFLYLERRFPFAVEDAEWRANHRDELIAEAPPASVRTKRTRSA